jgi:hypothetical protein
VLCHPKYRFSKFTAIGSSGEEEDVKGDYPCFKASYVHEELVEHFLLSPAEHALVETCHGETNRHSAAVLLKTEMFQRCWSAILLRCMRLRTTPKLIE